MLLLAPATDADLDELMSWFPDARTTRDWGGPDFRFPFTAGSFREDCRWTEMESWTARRQAEDPLTAFGQFYPYNGHINLARLVVHPAQRGQHAGRRFVRLLVEEAAGRLPLRRVSLFVYRNNEAAVRCYRALGFRESAYPADRPLANECYYLTRRLDSLSDW